MRVLGGPAVGDIRSRCLRLADTGDPEAAAVAALLAHRLPAASPAAARAEWDAVLDGTHALWRGVSDPYKHVIRSFLVHFHAQVLLAPSSGGGGDDDDDGERDGSSTANARFNFAGGSVGNFFFAGARTFFRSLEAAAFLFCRVARAPEGAAVLPAVATEGRLALGVLLEDGSVVVGQNEVSHPPPSSAADRAAVDKAAAGSAAFPLPAPVARVFYAAADGVVRGGGGGGGGGGGEASVAEAAPAANPRVLASLGRADAVVYGMGSLYTSLVPSLILPGVGEAVAGVGGAKILLLNGGPDRETARAPTGGAAPPSSSSPSPAVPMAASDVVAAVVAALRRQAATGVARCERASSYVTAVLAPRGGRVALDADVLASLGVHRASYVPSRTAPDGSVVFEADALVDAVAAEVAAAAVEGGGGLNV